jgi:membrane-bound lytic murein transglycosylase D
VASVTPPKDLGHQPGGKEKPGSCKSENKEEGTVEVKMEPIKNMPIKTIVSEKGPTMGWVSVEPEETLQHFAGWCDIPVQKLRQLNKLRSRQHIRVAQRIKVIFSRVDIEDFRTRRFEYHKARQEKFFSNYTIKKTITHTVKKRENVWYLCQNVYQIPFWLVRKYNPGKNLERLDKGDKLVIPVVTRLD